MFDWSKTLWHHDAWILVIFNEMYNFKNKYTIFGYQGKQVRDNIHSKDLANAFYKFFENPSSGQVYNIGGGVKNNCSILEAIKLCEELTGNKLNYEYTDQNRIGDHKWYVSDIRKFKSHYPDWKQKYTLVDTLEEMAKEIIIDGKFKLLKNKLIVVYLK